jgi:transketolase
LESKNLASQVRKHVLRMTSSGKSSHIGSALSIADILAVLYSTMSIFPNDPKNPQRDRFILSKGHAGAAVYAVLAESGFFDVDVLKTHYQDGSILSGHVSHKGVPGVEFSTGSLGHGLSVAAGMALAAKRRDHDFQTYALLSDGELDEGSNWEALLFAPHHKLNNLTCIVDYNKLQSLTSTHETLNLEPLVDKLIAFGWDVIEIDGHDHIELKNAIETISTKPKFILAHTIKGKGVSFMENKVVWHYRSASEDELAAAIKEIEDNS